MFITFEGMDGCGKSTQIRLLAQKLRGMGRTVVESAEPGGTAIGRQIRAVLLDGKNHAMSPVAEMLLYFACRAQNVVEVILPAIERGETVLSDRFTDSTLVYQGYGRGLGAEAVMRMHEVACRGLNPDLTIYLDIDLADGLQRARVRTADRMERQQADFYHRVEQAYRELNAREPQRIHEVDGRGTVEEVAERVWKAVASRV
jgi:dTMP kinase